MLLQNNRRLERFATTPQRNSGARLILFASADDPRLKRTHGCGLYKEQGWGPNFTVPTTSRIDAPAIADGKFTREIKVGQSTELGGIALGGDRGIQKVELSFDGEKSWLYRPTTDASLGRRTELLAGPLPQSMQMNTVPFS
ncbi:MAG TPA: hypothetical protein VFO40_05275, partial [Chthoniobacterales bacterium]|nr:hypothetical protein [Chthoniobacterales bacterium]